MMGVAVPKKSKGESEDDKATRLTLGAQQSKMKAYKQKSMTALQQQPHLWENVHSMLTCVGVIDCEPEKKKSRSTGWDKNMTKVAKLSPPILSRMLVACDPCALSIANQKALESLSHRKQVQKDYIHRSA